ncbi:MAG: DUF1343 domain-containing protein [Candidatus Hydrogenedentota bacterium]
MKKVLTGLDRIANGEYRKELKQLKIGLLAHPASVNSNLVHSFDIFKKLFARNIFVLFGPQHGFFGSTQDNMIECKSKTIQINSIRIPLYSLYSKERQPTSLMLKNIDAVVIDLQDIGTRVYTFIQTLYLVMKVCAKEKKKVIVLDRPNPISGKVEGPLLESSYTSFVGFTSIPLRHGMTIGELALFYNDIFKCELMVIEMVGWKRQMYFEDTGLPWVMPSPNIPTIDTALVYSGTVIFEGTNVSEGRGTTRPFEIIGSSGIKNPYQLAYYLNNLHLKGVIFRPLFFEPTFNKYTGKLCGGVQIHITDIKTYESVLCGIALLLAFKRYDKNFSWRKPPYEYEYKKLPIDILSGSPKLRKMVDSLKTLDEFIAWFEKDISIFKKKCKKYQIYM